jgi:hypothetical protein
MSATKPTPAQFQRLEERWLVRDKPANGSRSSPAAPQSRGSGGAGAARVARGAPGVVERDSQYTSYAFGSVASSRCILIQVHENLLGSIPHIA